MYNALTLIKRGEEIFILIDKINTHQLQPYSILDIERQKFLIQSLKDLYKDIPDIVVPKGRNELYLKELKRLCLAGVTLFEEEISSEISTPEKVLNLYNIKYEDIKKIEDWVLDNRQGVIQANNNQFEYHTKIKKVDVFLGVPEIREKAERLVNDYIFILKDILKTNATHLTYISDLLDSCVISPDSIRRRSYASRIAKTSGIGVESVVFFNEGNIYVEPEVFIPTFGHEVLGHLLNYITTDRSDLPFFLKWSLQKVVISSLESVTDYFESRIFDYILKDSKSMVLLSKEEPFENIYKRYTDNLVLEKYSKSLSMLGFWILSQTKQDDYKKQTEYLSKFFIEPKGPYNFVNRFRNDWNRGTGLLLPKIVSELRYSVDVVGKILNKYPEVDKNILEPLLVTGMWTSEGLIDYVDFNLN